MLELYFLTQTAQDALKKATNKLAEGNVVEALLTLGELRYVLDIMEIEQEKSTETDHNGQCRH